MPGDTSYTLLLPGLLSGEASGAAPLKALLDAGRLSEPVSWPRPHTYESLLAYASGYPDGLPGAALAWRAQFPTDPAPAHLVCADLMDLQAVARGLHFGDGPVELNGDEQEAFRALLEPLVTDALGSKATLHATQTRRWFVSLEDAPAVDLTTPGDASELGAGMALPAGADGGMWAALMNASQIALHEHPLNAGRIARGAAPVTSLWFSGAGQISDTTLPWTDVFSDCSVSRDLALASSARWHPLDALQPAPGAQVLICDRASRPEPALLRALETLTEALASGTIRAVDLIDPENGQAALTRAGRDGWYRTLMRPFRAS